MQLSAPELVYGDSGGGNSNRGETVKGKKPSDETTVLMQTEAEYKVPYSRSFTEKTASGHSRPGSTLDTR